MLDQFALVMSSESLALSEVEWTAHLSIPASKRFLDSARNDKRAAGFRKSSLICLARACGELVTLPACAPARAK
jgi:hypothetical protein